MPGLLRFSTMALAVGLCTMVSLCGCRSDLPQLPDTLKPQTYPDREPAATDPRANSTAAPRSSDSRPPAEAPTVSVPSASVSVPPVLEADGSFRPSRDGDPLYEGVLVRHPAIGASGEARFVLENRLSRDLPDFIVAVIFAELPDAAGGPRFRPRIVVRELPLPAGSRREVSIPAPPLTAGHRAGGFRVAPGVPEILTVRDAGGPGTLLLGGMLECVELDMDILAEEPYLAVGVAPAAGGPQGVLPDLEVQLLLLRSDALVWAGPWVRLPEPGAADGGIRRMRWRLRDVVRPAGSTPFLRVREVGR